MKKLLLILLCLPMIGFGQDIRHFTIKDLIINQVLENTINYIENKNKVTYTFKVDLPPMNNSINWNDLRLVIKKSNWYNHKWQIIELKDTIE